MRQIYAFKVRIYLTSQEIPRPVHGPQGHYCVHKDVRLLLHPETQIIAAHSEVLPLRKTKITDGFCMGQRC